MKNNRFLFVLAVLMFLSVSSFAQIEKEKAVLDFDSVEVKESEEIICPAVDALKKKYGNVIVTETSDSVLKLTLSVTRNEIENMLTTVVANGWYPQSLMIQVINSSTAVFMEISTVKNDSSRRFRVLQKLVAEGALPWKGSVLDHKEAYVTSIETQFGEDFLIKGESLKSNLIFTKLTPRISSIGADKENLDSERFASKKNFDRSKIFTRETYYDNDTGINGQPFFERGTYKEDPEIGRYMVFYLRCRW